MLKGAFEVSRHLRRTLYRGVLNENIRKTITNSSHIACNEAVVTVKAGQSSSRNSHQLWLPVTVAALGSLALLPYISHTGNERLEPEALKELADDLRSGSYSDKERAVSMLSSLTLYVDHHDAILGAGVLPSLLLSIKDERLIPQVRAIALECVAHLMKSTDAHQVAAEDTKFLGVLLSALTAEGAWADGPEEGGTARSFAARCCAELSGDAKMHPVLQKAGLADALATQSSIMAQESAKRGLASLTMKAVPGNLADHATAEEEMFLAAALFGLAGTPAGVTVLLKHPEAVQGTVYWSQSQGQILTRYGTGSLARLAISGSEGAALVAESGGLVALVKALKSSDGQTSCYAAKAAGELAATGGQIGDALLEVGAPAELLEALAVSNPAMSEGVRQGTLRCVLRAICTAANNTYFKAAFKQAEAPAKIQALLEGGHFVSDDMKALAATAVKALT